MKLYLDCGRYDIELKNFWEDINFLKLNRQFSDLLATCAIPHSYKEYNDGHEWANWRERMPEILISFFGKN